MTMENIDLDKYRRAAANLTGSTDPEEIEVSTEPEADSAGAASVQAKTPAPEVDDNDLDIEVVDDVPAEDKKFSKTETADEPVSEEELEDYSEKVKKRINKLNFKYNNERRIKEQALRERQAAEEIARLARAELEELRKRLEETQATAKEVTKAKLESEFQEADRAYRSAYEAGDSEALAKANRELMEARLKLDRVDSDPRFEKPAAKPLQDADDAVYSEKTASVPEPDEKVMAWVADNPWFQKDPLMTQFAQGLHIKMVEAKKPIGTDDYYAEIDQRMRKAFPDYDWGDEPEEEPAQEEPRRAATRKPSTPVASATRSTAPKKVVLTATEVGLAKRLGVPLEEFARQKARINTRSQ